MSSAAPNPPSSPSPTSGSRWAGRVAAVWGIAGLSLLLVEALTRLIPRAWTLVGQELTLLEAISLAGILIFFAAIEGYGGFQRSFAPRAAMRAGLLAEEGARQGPLRLLLAPLFCMALIGAKQRRLIVNWCLFVGIIGMIAIVMQLPEPWRAMVDAGVVVGLTWGLVATVVFGVRVMLGHQFTVDLELTEDDLAKMSTVACA